MLEKTLTPPQAASEVERLAKEHDERVRYWRANPVPGLDQKLLEVQYIVSTKFIAGTRELMAKAGKDGVDGLQAALPALNRLFQDHRAAVDKTVAVASKGADAESERFIAVIGLSRSLLWATLVAACIVTALLFYFVVRSILMPLGQSITMVRRMAEGDLSEDMATDGKDELTDLQVSLRDMQGSFTGIVQAVRGNAESVATASSEIAQGNQDLSERSEEQASTLQETAATMDQLGSTVRNNADNARQASQLALGASTVAAKGGSVVGQVVNTMSGINDSSKKIAEIIGVIDGIAFQTNILALNAAVEAARAGEQGRGFAVVASEVRSLAQRSAQAAKEIKQLITASVEQVELGTALVGQAGNTMTEIVTAIDRVSQTVADISAASTEQSAGVAQVGLAVSQMDQNTQRNAALVEESAAAAESLKQQAQALVQAVAVFKLANQLAY